MCVMIIIAVVVDKLISNSLDQLAFIRSAIPHSPSGGKFISSEAEPSQTQRSLSQYIYNDSPRDPLDVFLHQLDIALDSDDPLHRLLQVSLYDRKKVSNRRGSEVESTTNVIGDDDWTDLDSEFCIRTINTSGSTSEKKYLTYIGSMSYWVSPKVH